MHKRTGLKSLVVGLGFAWSLGAAPAAAEEVLTIRITRGIEGAEAIAIVPFGWQGEASGPPERIAGIIADNLARTGRYEPVPDADLPARPARVEEVDFRSWRILGAANLVIGRVRSLSPDTYRITFRLFDVFRAEEIEGFEFDAPHDGLRRVAHRISDVIYQALTGERGAFDTRIAYVTERTGEDGEKRYALSIADSDGHNPLPVLESTEPVLSPAWSPDGQRLAYVSYENDAPQIFIQNLTTGTREAVSSLPGLNNAPAWSPDGQRLALTLSKDGNSEIYILDLASRRLRRVTVNGDIDTEAAWSPDGRTLVFTSDRSGRPQLYTVEVTGGKPLRVVTEGRSNARARYSPAGDRLAFVHENEGGFRIAVLDLESGALRVLTETSLDESPSFAPNGGMILYATTGGEHSTLAAVSTDGRVRQELAVQRGAVREPAWSPYRRP